MERLVKLLSSLFYLGYSPIIPGTVGSLGGVALWLLVRDSQIAYIILTLAVIILGFLVCGRAEKIFGQKDSSKIVIDEAAGLLVALFLVPQSFYWLVSGFILYRAFDILKPFPIRRLQALPGSSGVMLDDLAAGLYTNLLLQLAAGVVMSCVRT